MLLQEWQFRFTPPFTNTKNKEMEKIDYDYEIEKRNEPPVIRYGEDEIPEEINN